MDEPASAERDSAVPSAPAAAEIARCRSKLVEHETSILEMRRRAIAERVEARAIIAEMDARDRAHETEHARARRHHEEALRDAQRSIDAWQRAVQDLRAELDLWKQSRIWRLGQTYWTFLARLRWVARGGPLKGQPMPSAGVGPGTASPSPAEPSSTSTRSAPSLPEGFLRRPEGRYDVLVLSIIDWDFRFQRPQQLATQFGRAGHRVFYLSTSAFLPPGGPAFAIASKAPNVAELRLRSPRPLDVYAGELSEKDVDALEDALADLFAEAATGDLLVKVDIPFWAPLAFRLREKFGARVVYDCMDEWTNFPGFGKRVLDREDELVRKADVTVVSADRLVEKHEQAAGRLVLARNAVDVEHYASLFGPNDVLGGVRRPVIGYYGALASWVDVPLLEKLAARHADATIVLAGGHFDVDLSRLAALENVRLLGQRPYDEMPKLLWNFDVCIIPFLVNEITEATNPVKFYEYLVGEKPVVAPELTELKPFAELCYLARGHDEFLRHVDEALAERPDDPRRPARRAVAEANDWSARYRAIDEAVTSTVPSVSVVVVTFGGFELTRACLDSLRRETWPRLDIVVVDNASTDATVPYLLRVAAEDPRVRVLRNSENRGFAAANNAGIAIAEGDVIVLLNNDTVVPPGLMGRLVAHLGRDQAIGLVCPTTNFAGNEAKIDAGYADLDDLPAWSSRRAREHAGRTFPLEVAAMYCVAARREVLNEVGPLDENFRIGMFEDDDFSLRVRQAGYSVVCAEDAYVHHVGQGSFRKLSAEAYEELWNRNKSYFEKKWGVAWKPHQARRGTAPASSKIGS